ncbi:MAG: hypothetical protein ACRYFX_30440 [Janthinobacterium lividum]
MRTLFSFPYLSVYLHEEGPLPTLETHWLGYAASADFRTAVAQVVAAASQYHVKGWIADDRFLGAVRPRDLEWVEQQVLNVLHLAGLQRFAQLEAEDTLNRLTIDRMYQQATLNVDFEFRRFADIDQARAWASGRA